MKTTLNIITISSIILCLSSSCIGLNQIHPEMYMIDSEGESEGESEGKYDNAFPTVNARDLSIGGTANCYIIPESGIYSFPAVKGNSSESVGLVKYVEVLWESFGTSIIPSKGDLVQGVKCGDGKIYFKTADTYRKGNAVVAAKDASGTILWSWHIWLTDQPQGQVYNNNAGTMMDRNLGATSATPGDVGALGLLYQWGRKDPFLGSSSISSSTVAKSTLSWPSAVSSNSSNGTISYATEHPTTFIGYNSSNDDWYYTGSSSTDDTRWQSDKTIYDPCPVGWRVPDGGDNGVWSTALGSSSGFNDDSLYDSTNAGVNFSGKFGSASTIWYPASGYRFYIDGSLDLFDGDGLYWSVTPSSSFAYFLYFDYDGNVLPSYSCTRAFGFSVRCMKEGTGGGLPEGGGEPGLGEPEISVSGAENLSDNGTANSYVVSAAGTYSFPAVKGNSYESVGSVSSVRVLWESFGTGEEPFIGDLVKGSLYEDGTIYFKTSDVYREGNAVIAALDENGIILWSWHLWFTDQPQEHVYRNNAGTMMDRNLGATSATPGEEGTLGLLYQWGRKDPFLVGFSVSTEDWPESVFSDPLCGTIEYAIENPMVYIDRNKINSSDWLYLPDRTLWQPQKTIYDPCPTGWRVPDGGPGGVWDNAAFNLKVYDDTNIGLLLGYDSSVSCWYPIAGYIGWWGDYMWYDSDDGLEWYYGGYWSLTSDEYDSYVLDFTDYDYGNFYECSSANRSNAYSVRCMKEGTGGGLPEGGGEPGLGEPEISVSDAENLSDNGAANSYVVSAAGTYSFPAVKGNSSESVGSVSGVEVLWESFGTAVPPSVGDLVEKVLYENGQIYFKTADAFKEGNAVIAAKDASGTILWSWHIWLTDEPVEQVYYNNAGTMMDRNLGATSATPGDVSALGLLYQWGRKDPFLGSSSISSSTEAKSTITWPSAVSSDSSNGTISYATEHPTTFITENDSNNDWYYTGSSSTDDTRWQSSKTIYDPCPAGWRVPDGGYNGVWSTALGSWSFVDDSLYDSTNEGMNFSGNFGSASTIWYPASVYRYLVDGALGILDNGGYYWSVTPYSSGAYGLDFGSSGNVYPAYRYSRAYGFSVRCVQESE